MEFDLRGPPKGDSGRVEITWSFEPKNLFESPQRFEPQTGVAVTIEDGQAIVELAGTSQGQELRDRVDMTGAIVRDLLSAPSLIDRVAVDLKSGPVVVYAPDGTREHHALLVGIEATIKLTDRADFAMTDATGKVVRDTKQDRIDRKRILAELIAKHRPRDRTLGRMLDSVDAARRDQADELVHLGEVFEALRTRLTAADPASLKASWKAADRLRSLCNDSNLRQGRHRGMQPETELRDAMPEELDEARNLARHLVESYVGWLEKNKP